jgi:hypothetical protein
MRTEYQVFTSSESWHLEKKINEKLAEGWQLQGGVSVALSPGGYLTLSQAMVRTEQEPKP